MDWKQIAERRLALAQDEVREAKESLNTRNPNTHRRYENALRELAAAERFLVRARHPESTPVGQGQGIFG